ncbi:DODA-type extradiol aromatic ring-opening family dioxygenase [Blastococcus tunisiensis]|uniref:2,3-dihydroxyphenylpropionate 1,2-dioxygenase n=1 Tax=Blastococcus tunisiensis TaxID=1798228 RepID=A0A1I2JL14_9ACTN|nr:2,3-dihydroxyphenylpropionate 1,2-dioxygenase [Blastococcus sp. DSM 46838]SFF54573.1 2,3-dihydroxyphenylpropionate 1,2-dioxygenase [Blastococcus sp. DSM 46838]
MAKIVGCISLSHSPFWNITPTPEVSASGGLFVRAVDALREAGRALSPDAVVIIGPDHARGLFYDLLPPFTIGTGRIEGVGDYETPGGELPGRPELASEIFAGVTRRGFDPAISLDLRVDHGLTQVYGKLFPEQDVPLIPVILNSGCPPLPTFKRSWDFGAAMGAALRESAVAARVLVVGSGGMSHWPASTSAFDPSITEEWRSFLINGRPRVDELEPTRRAKALAIAAGETTGQVSADWDRDLLRRIRTDAGVLRRLDGEDVEALAGPGAHELRTWAAATAAWGAPLAYVDYEPVPEWITGMGMAASHVPAEALTSVN